MLTKGSYANERFVRQVLPNMIGHGRTSSNAVKEPISERLSNRLHDQTSFCLLVFQVQEVCRSTAFIRD